jgi:SAM-dependent methyltransferase
MELGAGYCPIAPKSDGWRAHVVDHAPRDELRKKYAGAGVDTNLIEDVDTIWRGGPLHDAVPAALSGQVDLIIASHVLEHIPDLIGFFQSASRLLKSDGVLSLALPDRRYCFDCFRPWSTTGDLLQAHHRDTNRHSLKTAFNHMAYSAVVDGQLAWGPRPVSEPVFMDPFEVAKDTVVTYRDQDEQYKDYHAWQFTPAGFRLAMLEQVALGVSDWSVETLHGPENFEFFAVLRRGPGERPDPSALQAQRQALLLAQMAETREQIEFILGMTRLGAQGSRTDISQEILSRLADQDARLREMYETIAWIRAMLRPVRRIWRAVRGKH